MKSTTSSNCHEIHCLISEIHCLKSEIQEIHSSTTKSASIIAKTNQRNPRHSANMNGHWTWTGTNNNWNTFHWSL